MMVPLHSSTHSSLDSWYRLKKLASWAAVPVFFLGRSVNCVSTPSAPVETKRALFRLISRMRKPVMALPAGGFASWRAASMAMTTMPLAG